MKRYSAFWAACLALFAVLAAAPANALIISGQFSGTVVNFNGTPFSVRNGDPITGTFFVNTALFLPRVNSPGEYYYENFGPYYPPPPIHITMYSAPTNSSFDMQGTIDALVLSEDATGQTVRIFSGYATPCCAAQILLAGAPGELFTSLDLESLRSGIVDPSRSSAFYNSGPTVSFGVAMNSVSFDVNALPEPNSYWLLALGSLAMWRVRRKR